MTKKVHAFENEIFNHFRVREKKIKESIEFLKLQGYKITEEKEV